MMRDKVQVIAYLPISSEGTSLEAIDLNDVKVVAFRISTIGTKMKIKKKTKLKWIFGDKKIKIIIYHKLQTEKIETKTSKNKSPRYFIMLYNWHILESKFSYRRTQGIF